MIKHGYIDYDETFKSFSGNVKKYSASNYNWSVVSGCF